MELSEEHKRIFDGLPDAIIELGTKFEIFINIYKNETKLIEIERLFFLAWGEDHQNKLSSCKRRVDKYGVILDFIDKALNELRGLTLPPEILGDYFNNYVLYHNMLYTIYVDVARRINKLLERKGYIMEKDSFN